MPQSAQAQNSFLNEFTKELARNYYILYLEKAGKELAGQMQEKNLLMPPAMPFPPQKIPLQLPPQMQQPQIPGMIAPKLMPLSMPLQAKPQVQAYPSQLPAKPSIQPIFFNIKLIIKKYPGHNC